MHALIVAVAFIVCFSSFLVQIGEAGNGKNSKHENMDEDAASGSSVHYQQLRKVLKAAKLYDLPEKDAVFYATIIAQLLHKCAKKDFVIPQHEDLAMSEKQMRRVCVCIEKLAAFFQKINDAVEYYEFRKAKEEETRRIQELKIEMVAEYKDISDRIDRLVYEDAAHLQEDYQNLLSSEVATGIREECIQKWISNAEMNKVELNAEFQRTREELKRVGRDTIESQKIAYKLLCIRAGIHRRAAKTAGERRDWAFREFAAINLTIYSLRLDEPGNPSIQQMVERWMANYVIDA